jgi:hypothetical protein
VRGGAPRWGWGHGAWGRSRIEAAREARGAGARGQRAGILPTAIREAGAALGTVGGGAGAGLPTSARGRRRAPGRRGP